MLKILKYVCLFFSVFIIVINTNSGQESTFVPLLVDPELVEQGEPKNYYKYDLGDYIFWNGRYENNLHFKIQDKLSGNIVYNYADTISDAMILIPKFFSNVDRSIILIMVEVAVEYSWGQQVVLIKDQTVNYLGYMNYAVLGKELEESISDYCIVTMNRDKIWLTFKDVKVVDYSDDDKIIDGEDIKFELGMNGIICLN